LLTHMFVPRGTTDMLIVHDSNADGQMAGPAWLPRCRCRSLRVRPGVAYRGSCARRRAGDGYRGTVTWEPMALVIETDRLTLRIRDERDAEWYRELVGERGEDVPTLEESRARLARFRDLTMETGIGALAICRRAEGDTIGYCALIVGRASLDEPEVAFELLQRFHGHGYATEAAQALVLAAAATGRRRLWSTVGAWNAPSLRVLEKVGFRRDHSVTDDHGEVVYLVRDL